MMSGENWKYYKLESVAKLVSGRTPEREQKEYYAEEGTPWVKIENLGQGVIREAAEYLSEAGREKVNLVPENSVLFSIVGTVGKVGIAGRELATNQQIVSLIFDEERVLPLYGYYFLLRHAGEIKKLSNQTTMALISRKTLGQYRICVPDSLLKQREIVEKLRKFEEYQEKKLRLRQQTEVYENVLFEKIFYRELGDGEQVPLREFLESRIGSGLPKEEEPEGEFACIRTEEFSRTYLTDSVRAEWTGRKKEEDSGGSYITRPGDILLRNGRMILLEDEDGSVFFERNILRIRSGKEQLLPEVLYGWLSLPEIRGVLYAERKKGDTRKRPIRPAELERMKIPCFGMERQEQYAAALRKIRQIQRLLDREILYGRQVFETMCGILLSGKPWPDENATEKETEKQTEIQTEIQTEKETEKGRETETDQDPGKTENYKSSGKEEIVCRAVLAVLCGWNPLDERSEEYCQRRQRIFSSVQPYFHPIAFSFVTGEGQREYLLERDFFAYYSRELCRKGEYPMDILRKVLERLEGGEILDAHLAFQGETGIATENKWDKEKIRAAAGEGFGLLAEYSGYAMCGFLLKAGGVYEEK